MELSNYLRDKISQGRIAEQQPPPGSDTVRLVLKLLWRQFIEITETATNTHLFKNYIPLEGKKLKQSHYRPGQALRVPGD
jgi:hypothetical protein